MKILRLLLLLVLFSACGCETMRERRNVTARTQQGYADMEVKVARLEAQVDGMAVSIERLSEKVDAVSVSMDKSNGANSAQILELKRGLTAAEAARVQMRAEIVRDLSSKMASIINSSQPAAGAGQVGRWHTVESGQTLSAIARAYGVSTRVIVKANDSLSTENSIIKVGQKIFIPD